MSFILNADDYALSPEVDAAVIALAARGVVTATSAMVLSPRWPAAARLLDGQPLDTGLHLDFTSVFNHAPQSVTRLIARCWLGMLDRAALRALIDEQCRRFEDAMGRKPVFVDGHEHVHQFPQIRTALIEALLARYGDRAPAVRVCRPRRWRGMKAAIIGALGADALATQMIEHGLDGNTDFAGVYDLRAGTDLPGLWQGWLAGLAGPRPLVMCHVAVPAAPPTAEARGDPIHAARIAEYAWLSGPQFAILCNRLDQRTKRWAEI